MKAKTLTPLYAFFLVASGCASLTSSQLTEVNQFGQLTKSFSNYPGNLYTVYSAIHTKSLLYGAGQVTDTGHYSFIEQAYRFKRAMDTISPKMNLTFQILNKYGQALVLLTSPKHGAALDSASQNLGTNLDGLITKYNSLEKAHPLPTGIGGAVSELITLGGEQFIKSKQADEVRKFVAAADPLVGQLSDSLDKHLRGEMPARIAKASGLALATFQQLLDNERIEIKQDYTAYYTSFTQEVIAVDPGHTPAILTGSIPSSGDHYKKQSVKLRDSIILPAYKGRAELRRLPDITEDQACLQQLADLDHLDSLYNGTLSAISNLKKAHHKLLQDLQGKGGLKNTFTELQDYGDDVKKMYNAIKAIKTN